jgi:hypothetical protein
MSVPMNPEAVSARLRMVGELTDLRASLRMNAKLDMRPSSVSRRLQMVAQLHALCTRLGNTALRSEHGK